MKFLPLYVTNLWGVMNDNVLKMLACYIAVLWVPDEYKDIVVNATAGALVLPYLIFSPLAGKLPSRVSKVRIVRIAKICELPIMALAIVGFLLHSIWCVVFAVLLMGLQSALYSPAKYGLIKDIGGVEGVSEGMGGMESVSFIGMLTGSVLASVMADYAGEGVWFATLVGLAVLGVVSSMTVRAKETSENIDTSANVVVFLRDTTRLICRHKGLLSVVHLLSLFWWLSASLQIIMILHCSSVLALTPWRTGVLLATMAIGISVGCVVGGKVDKKHNMLGASPLIGLGMMVLLVLAFVFSDKLYAFASIITLVAFLGGMFKIPLDAEIQKRVDSKELGVVLAYFNQVSFIYIFFASATNLLITNVLGLSTSYVFLVLGIVIGLASLIFIFSYRPVVCQVGLTFMKTHYDICEVGREVMDVPRGDNMLVLPAHRAVIDPLMLFAELQDKEVSPLCDDIYFRIPVIGHVLSLFSAIEVPDLRRSRKGVEKVMALKDIIISGMQRGANILLYPSGHITTDGGESIGTRQLAYEACVNLPKQTHVIGIRISGLWGSQWSRYGKTETPSIVLLLLKSLVLIMTGAIFLIKKRRVVIVYEDITERVKEWSSEDRRTFNRHLEEYYSQDWPSGVEEAS